MVSTRELGDLAESLAQDYLRKLGYEIKATNWYHGHLELDIVAQGWRRAGDCRGESPVGITLRTSVGSCNQR